MQLSHQNTKKDATGKPGSVLCSVLSLTLLVKLALIPATARAELYFAPELISSDPSMIADVMRLQNPGAQLPGNYQVDIYVNGKPAGSRELNFTEMSPINDKKEVRDNTGLMACLTRNDLEELGVNVSGIPAQSGATDQTCVSPGKFIAEAFTAFDFQKMRLDISVPQASMSSKARGYISPEKWDDGINAVLLNYSYSGSQSQSHVGTSRSSYLNLNGGLNIGPWRLRDYRTWSENSGNRYTKRHWQHVNTYVQRAIIPLRSNLTLGDGTSDGDIFDAFSFRGMQIGSDDSMLPDSQRGFAPIIRGVASTNARINIRQNGYVVYETFVSPGAFAIDDLYPVYSSGDLEVTLTEADGSVKTFTVPYSSVPVLQREGRIKYSLTTGRYRAAGNIYDSPEFFQASLIKGLPHNLTAYSGMQYSRDYLAGLLGMGMNMGLLGAVSADITQASSRLADGSRHNGQSVRFLYARSLNSLGTTFQLTGYRYSTEGFHTLGETALKKMEGWQGEVNAHDPEGKPLRHIKRSYYNLYNSRRAKVQASISQRAGDLGSFYLSGVRETYWKNAGHSDSLQVGFNGVAGLVNYGLTYSHSLQAGQHNADKSLFLSLSMPLDALFAGKRDPGNSIYTTYSASRNTDGKLRHQAGLSGTALEASNLNWSLSQSMTGGKADGGNLSAGYRGAYGSSSVGYSYSDSYRQLSYGLNGGAILHENGITLGQQLGETSVLVSAPGITDTRIENESGIRTDWRGYTIKPNASVFRENRIALDTATLAEDADVDSAVAHVVPTRGAVVRAEFKGSTGGRVLMTLTRDGKPLPFGTTVSASERNGIVGDDGQVYLSGIKEEGVIVARWGAGKDQQCQARYRLPEKTTGQSIMRLKAVCIQ